uniref:Uncharacterized protein n=1 Tax=Romanomermis culicivorax TaxID=13658 RepID=A0A915JDC7_ROMCU
MPPKLMNLISGILILVALIIQNGRQNVVTAVTVSTPELIAATTVKANYDQVVTRKARDVASPSTTKTLNDQQHSADTVCSTCMQMGVSMRSIYLLILILPLTFLILGLIVACAAAYVLSSVLGRSLMELEQTVVTGEPIKKATGADFHKFQINEAFLIQINALESAILSLFQYLSNPAETFVLCQMFYLSTTATRIKTASLSCSLTFVGVVVERCIPSD